MARSGYWLRGVVYHGARLMQRRLAAWWRDGGIRAPLNAEQAGVYAVTLKPPPFTAVLLGRP